MAESTYYARLKQSQKAAEPVAVKRGRPSPGYSLTTANRKVSDEQIKEWLLELAEGEEHIYGYRLLAECLRRDHQLILNHKKAYTLCKELGLLQKRRQPKTKPPRRLAKNHVITGPNQLWQMDIKYGYVVGLDRFFFVLSVIDVFDRAIVGYFRHTSCEAKDACQTIGWALQRNVAPWEPMPIIRTDNGPQFVSTLFGDMCESLDITHERIPPKTPNMNAYIEAFHSNLERDLFSKETFETFKEAYDAVDQYMDFYNNRRMHGSLKRMAPLSFNNWVMQLEDRSDYHVAV